MPREDDGPPTKAALGFSVHGREFRFKALWALKPFRQPLV